jgi:alkylation response protein AidB-like acyl-CoA dehydrogenase
MSQFQDERMVPVVTGPVGAQRLWDLTVAHAQQRTAFGKPLAKMQVNRFKFVDMLIQITAAQALSQQCIRKMAAGEDITLDVSMAKVFIANMKQHVATTCVQLFGGAGYIWENPAARAYVDWRLGTIGGGTDEVMKEVIAKITKI